MPTTINQQNRVFTYQPPLMLCGPGVTPQLYCIPFLQPISYPSIYIYHCPMELTLHDMQNIKRVKKQLELILKIEQPPTASPNKKCAKCKYCTKPCSSPDPRCKSTYQARSVSARNAIRKGSSDLSPHPLKKDPRATDKKQDTWASYRVLNKPSYDLFYNKGHKKENQEKDGKSVAYKNRLGELEGRLNLLRNKETRTSMEYFRAIGQMKRRD